ncbi:hypothetical protein ACFS7Z_15915 [Pontibacter toksunensis]|uniref:Uncharacterized protein n=1 Tax=Pontibacter toksunensis TaxID=1332631 RepID=A0ABW6BWD2_9BACT
MEVHRKGLFTIWYYIQQVPEPVKYLAAAGSAARGLAERPEDRDAGA